MATKKRPLARAAAPRKKAPAKKRSPQATLKLIRADAAGANGIMLVFDKQGAEESWLLEQTSLTEFFALMLMGRMGGGRRLLIDAELTLEPPERPGGRPILCAASGPLEICTPVDMAMLTAMRKDIDRVLRAAR